MWKYDLHVYVYVCIDSTLATDQDAENWGIIDWWEEESQT